MKIHYLISPDSNTQQKHYEILTNELSVTQQGTQLLQIGLEN